MNRHLHPVFLAFVFIVIGYAHLQAGYSAERVGWYVLIGMVLSVGLQVLKSRISNKGKVEVCHVTYIYHD